MISEIEPKRKSTPWLKSGQSLSGLRWGTNPKSISRIGDVGKADSAFPEEPQGADLDSKARSTEIKLR